MKTELGYRLRGWARLLTLWGICWVLVRVEPGITYADKLRRRVFP